MNLLAKNTISVHASIEKVWEALTSPDLIKQYLYGTETITNWQEGSPIRFRGEWEGKSYEDKGIISRIEAPVYLRYTYWSSMSGTEDIPENYAHVTYELTEEGENTLLTITQDNISNEKAREHSQENWGKVLEGLKSVVERNSETVSG